MVIRASAFRHLIVTSSAIAMIAPAAQAQVQAQAYDFNIPAQDLDGALKALASATGQQVAFRGAVVRGKRSVGIKGRYPIAQAIGALLAGSGLVARRMAGDVFVIEAAAADKEGNADTSVGEDVVVTGSNIRGGNPESPVITITRKDIDRSGYSTAGDLIRNLPQSSGGGQNPNVRGSPFATSGGNYGTISSANLRGLGSDATLTLVNGRRLAYSGSYNGVDTGSIPFGAIERVEVLTDGASSIYGSDAIGGVVNFILRKRFDGALTTARTGISTYGDGPEYQINQLVGTGWSSGSIMAAYEYYKQEPIFTIDRPFSRTAPAPNSLVPEQKKNSGLIAFRQSLFDGLSIEINGTYTDRKSVDDTSQIQTQRQIRTSLSQYGVSPQLRWDLGKWIAIFGADLSGDSEDIGSYSVQRSNSLSQNLHLVQNNRLRNYEATTNGTIFNIPGGDVKLAVGAGYRKEHLLYTIDGFPNSTVDAGRSVRYGYAELRVPLVSNVNSLPFIDALDISASGRYEDYSDFGTGFSPRLGLSYKPIKDLALRGTWGRSFKAARLTQVAANASIAVYSAAQLGVVAPAGSVIAITQGGNPDLEPERANSYSLGADYSPSWMEGFKISASYFNIAYKGRISTPFASFVGAYTNPIFAPYITKNVTADQYLSLVNKIGVVNSFAGAFQPNQVFAIYDSGQQNLFRQNVHGVDVLLGYDFKIDSISYSIFANSSTLNIKTQNLSTVPAVTTTGTIFNPSKFRMRGGLQVRGSVVGGGVTLNHVGPEIDNSNLYNTVSPAKDVPISAMTTIDGQIVIGSTDQASVLQGFQLSFSAQNLLNTKPPAVSLTSGSASYPGFGYDSANYSPVGRYVSVTVAKRW